MLQLTKFNKITFLWNDMTARCLDKDWQSLTEAWTAEAEKAPNFFFFKVPKRREIATSGHADWQAYAIMNSRGGECDSLDRVCPW